METRIKVSRVDDNSIIAKTFPEAYQSNMAAASTKTLFGASAPGEPPPEPEEYLPRPGVSTYRGSRSVSSQMGRPWNSPADVVRQEIFQHTNLYVDGNIHPSIQNQHVRIIDKILDPTVPPPPSQYNSIPSEFKNKVNEKQLREMKEFKNNDNRSDEKMNINDIANDRIRVTATPNARPQPVITSSVPGQVIYVEGDYYRDYDNQAPQAPPPQHIERGRRHDSFIPPTQKPKPFQPTEEMILKVNGFNETNIKLLGEVSKNITLCTEMMAQLNDLSQPVNVNEMMRLLEFMDNESYLKIFLNTFEDLLNKNLDLHKTLTTYLSGNGKFDEEVKPVVEDTISSGNSNNPVDDDLDSEIEEGQGTSDTQSTFQDDEPSDLG